MTKTQKTRLKNIGIGIAILLFVAVVVVPVTYVAANSMYSWAFTDEVIVLDNQSGIVELAGKQQVGVVDVKTTNAPATQGAAKACLLAAGLKEGVHFRQSPNRPGLESDSKRVAADGLTEAWKYCRQFSDQHRS